MADFAVDESELWIGEMRGVMVSGVPLVVVRLDTGVCVYRDRCPHQGYPLSEGKLEGNVITCRVHQHTFQASSGEGINPQRPCLSPVPSRVEQGRVLVELGANGSATP